MAFKFKLGKKVRREDNKQGRIQRNEEAFPKTKKKDASDTTNLLYAPTKPTSPRVTGFKDRVSYEVVLEWDLSVVNRPFKYQRIGMKSWTNFEEAVQDITKFVHLTNSVSHNQGSKIQSVRVVGIYEAGAFKDWSNDPYNAFDSKKMKQHIQDAINSSKNDKSKTKKGKKPISYLKEEDYKVR